MKKIELSYYTDVLCVWAYVAQIRLDELLQNFAQHIDVDYRFITLFGSAHSRIATKWQERGGFTGFNQHIQQVGAQFPHIQLDPDLWLTCKPVSSAPAHLFIKAIDNLRRKGQISSEPVCQNTNRNILEMFIWQVRHAFFHQAQDISQHSVLWQLVETLGLPVALIEQQLKSGDAMASFCEDFSNKETLRLEGSPTYILNHGRQKLYGNVGYKIIESNILELLSEPGDRASWC